MQQFRLKIDSSFQTTQKNDFIINIKYDRESNSMILIHQLGILDVRQLSENGGFSSLKFESNVYDAMIVNSALVTSNKNMPIRIYKMNEDRSFDQFGNSIYDRKPNSQMFLTPLQFAKNNERLVGGGKKFMSQYDLTKLVAKRFKEMNKKYISSIELMGNVAVTGSFTGQLTLLDLNSGQIVMDTKPHMDLVTKIKRFNTNDYNFLSLARKDNLSYLWDIRNMSSFVKYFEHQLHGNQRTGLDLSIDDRFLYIGSQHGTVFVHSLEQPYLQLQQIQLGLDKCVSSICYVNQEFFCAVGQRQFPFQNQKAMGGTVFTLRMEFQ